MDSSRYHYDRYAGCQMEGYTLEQRLQLTVIERQAVTDAATNNYQPAIVASGWPSEFRNRYHFSFLEAGGLTPAQLKKAKKAKRSA